MHIIYATHFLQCSAYKNLYCTVSSHWVVVPFLLTFILLNLISPKQPYFSQRKQQTGHDSRVIYAFDVGCIN